MLRTTKNIYEILGSGLEFITNEEDFTRAMKKVTDDAFATIFQAQNDGQLKWRRSGITMKDLVTDVTVKNGRDEDVRIPVVFFTNVSSEGFDGGYLMLEDKYSGLCRNTADQRVRNLYQQLTGKTWPYAHM